MLHERSLKIGAETPRRKLIIQIPCHNEAEQLPDMLADLPRAVDGFDVVEWLVIDDGSTDETVDVARAHGVDHVVELEYNQGLATAFMRGLEAALKLGADVIVNTDGDNQYDAASIPALTKPVVEGKAKIAIGARPIDAIAHFSPTKRLFQKVGSWVVRAASRTNVLDAPSGFRAIHRDAALKTYVFGSYTYTLEMIIQAGRLGIPIVSVPVSVNEPTRESRLMKSSAQYIRRSAVTVFRILVLYKPLKIFTIAAAITMLPGLIAFGRFLALYAMGQGSGNIQSLVLGGALIGVGAMLFAVGLLADLIAANRTLLSEIRARQLGAEIAKSEALN